jgi:hypothetical protein
MVSFSERCLAIAMVIAALLVATPIKLESVTPHRLSRIVKVHRLSVLISLPSFDSFGGWLSEPVKR